MLKNWRRLALFGYFSAWVGYFGWFWAHAFRLTERGEIQAGLVNIWGDWAIHFTMGSAMAYRSLWLTDSPFIAGARFSYPFATNFISALLLRVGVPFLPAFVIPSFLCCCGLVGVMYLVYRTWFKSLSIAIVASLIFLLNGGLGFVYLAQDILNSPTPFATFINPVHEYTRLDDQNIKWISIIDSMAIPQRAFALGFPLTILALTLIYQAMYRKMPPRQQYLRLGIASLTLGLMPIIHTHSFLAAGVILTCWCLSDLIVHQWSRPRLYRWLGLGFITCLLAIPLYIYFFSHQVNHFINWYPGWLAREFEMPWLLFWLKNWGLTPLIGCIGWFVYMRQGRTQLEIKKRFSLFLPFFLIFVLANLFLFQPFSWDNTKLIVWASVGISGLAGWAIVTTWKTATRVKKGILALLFFSMVASGGYDAYWDLRTDQHSYTMYTQEELELSDWVKANTPIDAVWLTSDKHNHWLFNLTGRQPVMAYRGWLWTHGYDYFQIETDERQMFQHPEQRQLFDTYNVSYVVVGPEEIRDWQADLPGFLEEFKTIKTTDNYTLFQRDILR